MRPESLNPPPWPEVIWLVRHGESAANVARREAELAKRLNTGIQVRDMDVPLSDLGKRQAMALGRWFGQLSSEEQPTVALTSPYIRSIETLNLVLTEAGIARTALPVSQDERLREREFGIFDRLTDHGIRERYPELDEDRRTVGKFYYRPPGGESWCDVILRLRSVIDTLALEYPGERLLIVTHQAAIFCFRYLLERMTEEQVLVLDRSERLANCSVTFYAFDPSRGRNGMLALKLFNFVAPLEELLTPVTTAQDVPMGPK